MSDIKNQDINILRQEIDTIDRELVSLFKKRMEVAANVAEYKRQTGMQVLDASRERALLAKVAELSGEEKDALSHRGNALRQIAEKLKDYMEL